MKKILSIIIPTYNEEKNIHPLFNRLTNTLRKIDKKYEIIFVDDGSTDKTYDILEKLASKNKFLKVIRFRRNFGQSAAISAGFKHSKGDIIITLDADLQNYPEDIPNLLRMVRNYDLVCGWRKKREDSLLSKKIPSLISNWIARKLTDVKIHDFGCTLRAYQKDVVKNIDLYGEMHRYIPVLAKSEGYSITEVEVKHANRKYEKSKYKAFRLFKGLCDLLTIVFIEKYGTRPAHFFGSIGIISFGIGSLILLILLLIGLIFWGTNIIRPLFYVALILILGGIQFITFGVQSEMITKLRYQIEDKKFYKIKKTINL